MRSPVDRSPFGKQPKRSTRNALLEIVRRADFRLEVLEDTRTFIRDESTKTPEMMVRFASIPGMITHRRGMYYYWLSYACSVPGDIVEIGTWQGRSTAFLAQGAEDSDNGSVHAVDTFIGNPGNESAYAIEGDSSLEAGFRQNMERVGLAHRIVVHAKSSADAAADVHRQVVGARILCIDGEHAYHAVRDDLARYADLVVPGGLLVLDDYSTSFPGVVRACREHLEAHPERYLRPVQDRNLMVVKRRT